MAFSVGWRILLLSLVVGVCVGLVTGFVENTPGGATIPENKYYGFPLIWRLSDPFVGETYFYLELFADLLFWIAVASAIALVVKRLKKS